jgi:outer membrane lipoprotein-sorting protein
MSNFGETRNHVARIRLYALLTALLCVAFTIPLWSAPPDARAVMEAVYQQDKSHDMTIRANLDIFGKDGHGQKKKFVLKRIGGLGDSKTLLTFTDPAEIKGVALLSIIQKGVTDRQWLYTPAIERVRSIAPRERSEPFAGSDFTYEDIAERVLDDFAYKLLSDVETMQGHKTYKIEATPVAPDRSQYKYVYFWVGQDVPVLLAAEMYDQNGKKVREFHASGLKKVDGIWGARHLEMISPIENTRTVLTIDDAQFNTGLDEKLFTPEALASSGEETHKKSPKKIH